nr:MAG TPA: hypothetical protein [Caudoviricetes sp.]
MRNCTLFFYGQNGFFVEVQFLDCQCFMFFVYETENVLVGQSVRLVKKIISNLLISTSISGSY